MIIFSIIVLTIVGEFLHLEYISKHPDEAKTSIVTIRMMCISKELFMGYVIIGALISRLSFLISFVIAFIVFLPIIGVLHIYDSKPQLLAENDPSSDEPKKIQTDLEAIDLKKATPLKLDSNRVYPAINDPDTDYKEEPSANRLMGSSIRDSNVKLCNSEVR